MLKNILNLNGVSIITKEKQSSINGGFNPLVPCHFAPPCPPNKIAFQCECFFPWEI